MIARCERAAWVSWLMVAYYHSGGKEFMFLMVLNSAPNPFTNCWEYLGVEYMMEVKLNFSDPLLES